MKGIRIKGKDASEKFNHLERILQRLARRSHRTFVGLVPAAPVFGFVADPMVNPVVMQAIFPADGIITKGAIFFGRMKSRQTAINIRFEGVDGYSNYGFAVPKKGVVTDFDYVVKAGTRMTVSVLDPDENTGDVWIGFMYEVDMKSMKQLRIPFDFIEKLAEEALDVE